MQPESSRPLGRPKLRQLNPSLDTALASEGRPNRPGPIKQEIDRVAATPASHPTQRTAESSQPTALPGATTATGRLSADDTEEGIPSQSRIPLGTSSAPAPDPNPASGLGGPTL